MEEYLRRESERLAQSWMRHDAAMLRDYLVASVEDPRLNLQSVFSRHFLLRALSGQRWTGLMEQECRFAAVINWLAGLVRRGAAEEELRTILYALERGADNAEGLEIPHFVVQSFAALPGVSDGLTIPNYVQSFLAGRHGVDARATLDPPTLDTFQKLWREAIRSAECGMRSAESSQRGDLGAQRLSVVEPACGSANDYRFLHAYGITELIDYTGFDLCAKNIANARALFPQARFEPGNVFEIDAPDKAYDLCFVHDLFEHLSLEGLRVAVHEVCRITRLGLCANFFNMDEIPEHLVRPVEEYHWNTLSMARMRELFARQGFAARVLHVGTFLRQQFGCAQTHDPNAYTFVMWRLGNGKLNP